MRLTKEMYCDQDEYRRRAGVYRDTGRVRTQTLCILYSSRSPFFTKAALQTFRLWVYRRYNYHFVALFIYKVRCHYLAS